MGARGSTLRASLLAAYVVSLLLAASATADTIIPGGNVINETWTPAGSPYIVQGDITVPNGASLNVEAGAVILFASTDATGSGFDPGRIEVTVAGMLDVEGTSASPVIFRAQTGPSPRTWYGIVLTTATLAHLTHCT